ncbi:hypothetical protein D3C83_06980 [compost metagenome]
MAVGNEIDHLGENLLVVGELRDVALAAVEVDCDCEVTELGEAAADVLDVLVHAEDFLNHQHQRELAAFFRHGAVRRHRAGHGLDLHLAGGEAVGVGCDRGGSDRLHDLCEPLRQQRRH